MQILWDVRCRVFQILPNGIVILADDGSLSINIGLPPVSLCDSENSAAASFHIHIAGPQIQIKFTQNPIWCFIVHMTIVQIKKSAKVFTCRYMLHYDLCYIGLILPSTFVMLNFHSFVLLSTFLQSYFPLMHFAIGLSRCKSILLTKAKCISVRFL